MYKLLCLSVAHTYDHLWEVANVVGRVCHYEIKVYPLKAVVEVKLGAINVRMPLQQELELDVLHARGDLEDIVAATSTFMVGDGEPLALGGAECYGGTL